MLHAIPSQSSVGQQHLLAKHKKTAWSAHISISTEERRMAGEQQKQGGRTGPRLLVAGLVLFLSLILFFVQDIPINGKGIKLGHENYQMEGLVAPAVSGVTLRIFSCK